MVFKSLSQQNFKSTLTSRVIEIVLKSVFLIMLVKSPIEHMVKFTYFMSLSMVLSSVFDFGQSRVSVLDFEKSQKLAINLTLILLMPVSILVIYISGIKYYNLLFLMLVGVNALTYAVRLLFQKYYEFIGENRKYYSVFSIVTVISYLIAILTYFFTANLVMVFLIIIVSNLYLILYFLHKNSIGLIFSFQNLKLGLPFVLNSVGAIIFSDLALLIVNQIAEDNLTANYAMSSRIVGLILLASTALASSSFSEYRIDFQSINLYLKRGLMFTAVSFGVMYLATIVLAFFNDSYEMTSRYVICFIPFIIFKSLTPFFSTYIDYSSKYYLRTLMILFALILEICLSSILDYFMISIESFIVINGLLMMMLFFGYKYIVSLIYE